MNEDQKPTPNPKERKPRSLGSFLLFLVLLMAVLALVGRQSMTQVEQLSQDEYLALLHQGRIEVQEFQGNAAGSNVVKGTFVEHPGEKAKHFQVEFGDVEAKEAEWQELKAIHVERTMPAESFVAAVDGGWYEPVRGRSLRLRTVEVPQTVPGADPQVAPPAKVTTDEKLFVEVIASSRARWERQDGVDPTAAPPFFLPAQSSHVWLEVDTASVPGRDTPELGAVLGRLANLEVPVSTHTFELGDRRGTSWGNDSSTLQMLLVTFGPWLLLGLLFFFFMRQARGQGGGGMMSFGKSRAQLYTKENHTGVTFQDVAGAAEAKAEVREIVEFLRNPSRFTRIGGRIPRGILLVGPPGCGKTLLAKAIAGEAEVPFFAISGSDFVEMFVGVGASRVRDLFEQGKKHAPCIIFIDEIDAVGRHRGAGLGGGHDEREQTLNQLLVEMDGFEGTEGIILVAATNRPDVLDPALLRPGRFDRRVTVPAPDVRGREAILAIHTRRIPMAEAVDLSRIAKMTPGFSGADLENLCNEAALLAAREDKKVVEHVDFENARSKLYMGPERRSMLMPEPIKRKTAYHEAGHAIIAHLLPGHDPVHKVTIVPRGRALGVTWVLPEEDRLEQTREQLLTRIAMAMGGRAAEELVFDAITGGARNDIQQATRIARHMVCDLGMSDDLGPVAWNGSEDEVFLGRQMSRVKDYSEHTARRIDNEVRGILTRAYGTAKTILSDNMHVLHEVAGRLIERETLDADEFANLVDGLSPVGPSDRWWMGGDPPATPA